MKSLIFVLALLLAAGGRAEKLKLPEGSFKVRSVPGSASHHLEKLPTGLHKLLTPEAESIGNLELRSSIGRTADRLNKDAAHRYIEQLSTAAERFNSREKGETLAYSKELPFLQVRATGVKATDEALIILARERIGKSLDAKFDVGRLRVIAMDISDPGKASALEVAHFRRSIPSEMRDEIGPLTRLPAREMSQSERIATLKAYRGSTVLVVGHIPQGSSSFFRVVDGKKVEFPIREWADAARQTEVNLIPLGCHSGMCANFGADAVVGSTSILNGLARVSRENPTTMKAFLKALAGDEMRLTINPLDVMLFTRGAEISQLGMASALGRVWVFSESMVRGPVVIGPGDTVHGVRIRGARYTPQVNYDEISHCFGLESANVFDECFLRVTVEKQHAADAEWKKEQEQNELARAEAEKASAVAASKLPAQGKLIMLATLGYLIVLLPVSILLPHGILMHESAEGGDGNEPEAAMYVPASDLLDAKHIRASIRKIVTSSLRAPYSLIRVLAAIIFGSLEQLLISLRECVPFFPWMLGGVFLILAHLDPGHPALLVALGVLIGIGMILCMFALDSSKALVVTGTSMVLWGAALGLLCLAIHAYHRTEAISKQPHGDLSRSPTSAVSV